MKMFTSKKFAKNLFLSAFTLLATTATIAQEATEEEEVKKPKFTLGGSVDTYFKTNLSSSDEIAITPGSSFAESTGFALGMANAILSYEGEKTGAVADLAYGPRAFQAIAQTENGPETGFFVNQLYAYWNVSKATTLTFGRFNTYLGYEVISPTGNFNYSTSYLFSYGPFSHVGLKADFALDDDWSLMLAVMNVTDENFNQFQGVPGAYSLGAQLGYKEQYLNFYYDGEAKLGFEIDYTGGFDITDSLFLGINAAYQDNDGTGFYGAALYPQLATCDSFTLGLRAEYFQEMGDYNAIGFGTTQDQIDLFGTSDIFKDESVLALTLTGSYSLENLTIKPEIRLDSVSEDLFPDNDGDPTKSLSSFLLAAIYSF